MARTVGSDGKKTRARILSAASPLLAQMGYAAVSIRQIADEVGVNASALYNHFPNKQSILVSVMSDHMELLLSACKDLKLDEGSPSERLTRFCHNHIQFNTSRPDDVFIAYMELRSLEPENFKLIEAKRKIYENILREIIKSGVQTGAFHVEDDHVAAMSILGSLTGINTWYRKSGRLSKARVESIYTAIALRTVGYQSEDADV